MEDFDVEIETSYQSPNDLRNIIDKDVQSMLYPLKVMQIMALCPKYQMKNNFIKPNDLFNMFILIFGLIIFLTGYIYRFTEILVDENLQRYNSNQFLYFASYYDFLYYSSGFIMNFVIHCIHTKKIVTFVLIFQEVHRFLNKETSFKWCVIRNWINVIIMFAFYIVTVLFMTLGFYKHWWYFVLNIIFLFSLDANLIYAISLVKLLADKVELWKVKVLLYPTNEQRENDEMDCDQMFEAYLHILKCYDISKTVFQQPVLFQTVETFFRCLINIQVMIEFRRPFFVITPLASVLLYSWIIKTLVLQFALNLQAETFYEAVELAQDSCSRILASCCTNDDQKNLCKNIQRVHRASFSKMTACGLFYVDICQPLRLMALLTNYTVVLLQFAFL